MPITLETFELGHNVRPFWNPEKEYHNSSILTVILCPRTPYKVLLFSAENGPTLNSTRLISIESQPKRIVVVVVVVVVIGVVGVGVHVVVVVIPVVDPRNILVFCDFHKDGVPSPKSRLTPDSPVVQGKRKVH